MTRKLAGTVKGSALWLTSVSNEVGQVLIRVLIAQEGSEEDVDRRITKTKLALHCRRRTRGEDTTVAPMNHLLQELMGGKGNDALGVPLLDRLRMEHIQDWQHHKGWHPNSEKVFRRKIIPTFQPPAKYTGELIGIQYLFRQTGQTMQDMHPDSEEANQMQQDLTVEEEQEDEGFEDNIEDLTVGNLLIPTLTTEVSDDATSTDPATTMYPATSATTFPCPATCATVAATTTAPAASATGPATSAKGPATSATVAASATGPDVELWINTMYQASASWTLSTGS
ncbi:hypothetical protein SKAU_G00137090 [Synaphobranchus kaupii]|uniref:Uncharacterized protein n=1 Tax=Synaphobranchus kaupii TaxID=118154 RepID=A0A9Q1J3W4_SYNKA|nr:hypothetical protein SKAU_G00137090 [Synaphobranchus kaupii]